MKKIFLIFAIVFSMSYLFISNNFALHIFSLVSGGEVRFYCGEKNDLPLEIKNGQSFIYSCDADNATNFSMNLKGCFGFSVHTTKNNIDLEKLLASVNILRTEVVEGYELFYGLVPGLVFSTFINNQKINLQIAVQGDNVVLGSPIILGDF